MKKPDNYIYPAILTYEDGYDIAVTFPDLPGCATCGSDEEDAMKMAKEALKILSNEKINFSEGLVNMMVTS